LSSEAKLHGSTKKRKTQFPVDSDIEMATLSDFRCVYSSASLILNSLFSHASMPHSKQCIHMGYKVHARVKERREQQTVAHEFFV
jgi:hypothetical protein